MLTGEECRMKNSAKKTEQKIIVDPQKFISNEIEKLKQLKKRIGQKMTVARLKAMKGFEALSDEAATELLQQMEEYVTIVLMQMSRLKIL